MFCIIKAIDLAEQQGATVVNDGRNNELYAKYKALTYAETNVIFGGRLAEYKYYDMAPVIEKVLDCLL